MINLSINIRKNIFLITVLAWLAAPLSLADQLTGTSATIVGPKASAYDSRASLMFDDANFRGALDQLNYRIASLTSPLDDVKDQRLLQALAAMRVPGANAQALLNDFLHDFPASAERERVLLAIADCLFDRSEFTNAYRAYSHVEINALNPSLAECCLFRQGFCLLKLGEYDRADIIFANLAKSSAFANDARFYQGYIRYIKGDYRHAADIFNRVNRSGLPASLADYYLAQIAYLSTDFDRAAARAKALITANQAPEAFITEACRIAGESLYQLGETSQALSLLRQYMAETDRPAATARYMLGVEAYNNADYNAAASLLAPVTSEDSAIGQSACLYMGQIYLKQGNYNAATMTLDKACRMTHDMKTQENAFYNLAIAKMKGGKVPFGSTVVLFEEFLKRYPNSPLTTEVADFVVNSYITDDNYEAALTAINSVAHPTHKVLVAKQKVLYALGSRELQAGAHAKAQAHLSQAADMKGLDDTTAAEATLWLGEALYRQGKYNEAINAYNRYLENPNRLVDNRAIAYYDLGYARYAAKDFANAKADFQKYLKYAAKQSASDQQQRILADAYNRLADCHYYLRDFKAASSNYDLAYKAYPAAGDYPMYQQGIMEGLSRHHAKKIDILTDMIARFPSSALVPSALIETAESYSETGNYSSAVATYSQLADNFPRTEQGRKARLLLAMTHLSNGHRDDAIANYKQVITSYPTSEEASLAADDLKQIYADAGRLDLYLDFIAQVPNAPKPENAELAALTLQGAEKAVEDGRNDDALRLADELVKKYPDTPQAVRALAIRADMERAAGLNRQAAATYTLLVQRATSAAQANAARLNLLRVCAEIPDHNRTIEVADQLLSSSSPGAASKSEILFLKACALKNVERPDEAVAIWQELADDPDDLFGSKSAVALAQHFFDDANDAKALEIINNFIEANPPHNYWLARGFILLSDIKRHQGETFEADEYLRSLRRNYPGSEPDIFNMIDQRLK